MPYTVLDPSTATVIAPPTPDPSAPGTTGISLSQARDELTAMLKGRQDILPGRYDFWLNRAYIDIATGIKKLDELRSSLTFDTVADQPLYLLPEITITTMTLSRVDTEISEGGEPLEKIDLPSYRRKPTYTGLSTERKPRNFVKMNRLLILEPTPTAVWPMILDFRFEPAPLVNDDDCPILHEELHESWLLLARKKMLSALSEWEASLAAGNDFAGHIRARQDREVNEEENRVVSSSAPRTDEQLRRRGASSGRPHYRG